MELLVPTIIATLLSALLIGAAVFYYRRKLVASSSSSTATLLEKIQSTTAEAESLIPYASSYASSELLEKLVTRIRELEEGLRTETETLKVIEGKLDGAQRNVEQREAAQQELKSSKEEDESKLEELLNQYADISSESIALEQQLAASLKNLDAMMGELQLTEDQRAVLTELSNALTVAGSRLRDLLTEYQTIHDRLEGLKQQHRDLEDEYTRLVEQQLGE